MFENAQFDPELEPFPPACGREQPHAPHVTRWLESAHGCDGTEEVCAVTCPVQVEVGGECAGLRAHPLTQIGRRP